MYYYKQGAVAPMLNELERGDPSLLIQNLSSFDINNQFNVQGFIKISIQVLFQWIELKCALSSHMLRACYGVLRD